MKRRSRIFRRSWKMKRLPGSAIETELWCAKPCFGYYMRQRPYSCGYPTLSESHGVSCRIYMIANACDIASNAGFRQLIRVWVKTRTWFLRGQQSIGCLAIALRTILERIQRPRRGFANGSRSGRASAVKSSYQVRIFPEPLDFLILSLMLRSEAQDLRQRVGNPWRDTLATC